MLGSASISGRCRRPTLPRHQYEKPRNTARIFSMWDFCLINGMITEADVICQFLIYYVKILHIETLAPSHADYVI